MAVVATEVPLRIMPVALAHAVWATKPGLFMYYLVIVDADVESHQLG
jgi:hypothetical protein